MLAVKDLRSHTAEQNGGHHGQQGLGQHVAAVVHQAVSPGGQAFVQVAPDQHTGQEAAHKTQEACHKGAHGHADHPVLEGTGKELGSTQRHKGHQVVQQDFTQEKKLYPIVGSAQGEKDKLGMPTAKNYVDKMVTIKNTGSEKAYIRAYFAIPSALDDGYETFNAGMNVLHFNFGNKVVDGNVISTYDVEWNWKHGNKWNYFETTIDDIKYNVYFADYYQPVDANATTEQFVQGVYLDKTFDIKDGKCYAFGKEVTLDDGWDWNSVSCPVFAIACQAEGFDNAAAAMEAAFGANYNPWGTPASNWQ